MPMLWLIGRKVGDATEIFTNADGNAVGFNSEAEADAYISAHGLAADNAISFSVEGGVLLPPSTGTRQ